MLTYPLGLFAPKDKSLIPQSLAFYNFNDGFATDLSPYVRNLTLNGGAVISGGELTFPTPGNAYSLVNSGFGMIKDLGDFTIVMTITLEPGYGKPVFAIGNCETGYGKEIAMERWFGNTWRFLKNSAPYIGTSVVPSSGNISLTLKYESSTNTLYVYHNNVLFDTISIILDYGTEAKRQIEIGQRSSYTDTIDCFNVGMFALFPWLLSEDEVNLALAEG
jgi:hypothetical protein